MKNATNPPICSDYRKAPGYSPDALLDTLIAREKLKNDAALSRVLMVAPPVISRVRHGLLPVTNNLLVRMHDTLGISIDELRKMMGVQS